MDVLTVLRTDEKVMKYWSWSEMRLAGSMGMLVDSLHAEIHGETRVDACPSSMQTSGWIRGAFSPSYCTYQAGYHGLSMRKQVMGSQKTPAEATQLHILMNMSMPFAVSSPNPVGCHQAGSTSSRLHQADCINMPSGHCSIKQ